MYKIIKNWHFLTSLLLVLVVSCGKAASTSPTSTTTQTVSTKTVGGASSGTVSASANLAQVVPAASSSAIKGAAATFNPGTLKTDVTITVQQADSLVSNNTALDLNVDASKISSDSNAVLVQSSGTTDPVNPYSLQIPLAAGLSLATSVGVLYRVTKASSPGKVFTGLLAASKFSVANGAITISAAYFGAYQAVNVDTSLTLVSEVVSSAPIVPEGDVFPTGTWVTTCYPCRNNIANCYETDTLSSVGSSITIDSALFAESSCILQAATSTAYVTYLVGSSVTKPSGATALDAYFEHFLVTPIGSAGASFLNGVHFCSLTWTANQEQNVTGLDCDPSNPDGYDAQTVYTNFLVSGKDLTLGASVNSSVDDGTTVAKRMLGSDTITYVAQ